MAEAGKEHAGLGLPGGGAAQWPLQRYGRFMPLGTGESPGPGLESGTSSSPTWKVFDSNEESGHLVLTIVISGHFFISQGQTLLEGFSLVGSKNWLKIVRRMDCLLFGTTIKAIQKQAVASIGSASPPCAKQEPYVPGTVQWRLKGAGAGTLLQLCAEPGPVHTRPGARRSQPGAQAKSWLPESRWKPREGCCTEHPTTAWGFIGQLSDSDFSAQCMGMQQDPNRGPEFGH
ncbi:meiotic recombination protein REC114 isoform X6 [Sus scrofa]|uniref:meiotic recombination protein REC114 isoform X6 n=1 Tax=Sus scrofa TaxID=9823 RepID=UPI0006B20B43|nr:meiotic recombination protein REC114 isoform X6 [Sus scrofa]